MRWDGYDGFRFGSKDGVLHKPWPDTKANIEPNGNVVPIARGHYLKALKKAQKGEK